MAVVSASNRSLARPLGALLAAGVLAVLVSPRVIAAPKTQLEAGTFLVARPTMADPHFARTVVLLLSHGEEGTLGVIINRRTRTVLSDLLPQLDTLTERRDSVFWGGPVGRDKLVFLLHAEEPPEDCEPVLAGVCTGNVLDLIEHGLDAENPVAAFKTCVGYAGWAHGQLEWEIEQDGWYVLPATSQRVFEGDPKELWDELIEVAEAPTA